MAKFNGVPKRYSDPVFFRIQCSPCLARITVGPLPVSIILPNVADVPESPFPLLGLDALLIGFVPCFPKQLTVKTSLGHED